MKIKSLLLIAGGLLTLQACSPIVTAPPERNQFANLPKSATTQPEVSDFRAPLQLLDQTFVEQLRNIEKDLDDCLQLATCKQPI